MRVVVTDYLDRPQPMNHPADQITHYKVWLITVMDEVTTGSVIEEDSTFSAVSE